MRRFYSREFSQRITITMAFGYALASLLLFINFFFLFSMGHNILVQEPNVIIAVVELISAIMATVIISVYFMKFAGNRIAFREQTTKAEMESYQNTEASLY